MACVLYLRAMNTPARRYTVEFGAAMAAYGVLLVTSIWLLKTAHLGGWRYIAALLPVLPALFGMWAFIRFLRRIDELQRRIQLHALGFSFGSTVIVSLTVGFLKNAGLPQPNWFWLTPLMIALWGLATFAGNRRYP